MKVSSFVIMLLIVSGVFTLFSLMVIESNEQFPDSDINSSAWDDQYDYVEDINRTSSPLLTKLSQIEDEELGWFTRISAGISAIPSVVLAIPRVIISMITLSTSMVNSMSLVFLIPSAIVLMLVVAMFVWAIFKLIEFIYRKEI